MCVLFVHRSQDPSCPRVLNVQSVTDARGKDTAASERRDLCFGLGSCHFWVRPHCLPRLRGRSRPSPAAARPTVACVLSAAGDASRLPLSS